MVVKFSKDGRHSWHEPPYTDEEEAELERRLSGMPVMVARAPVKKAETASPTGETSWSSSTEN